MSSDLAVRDRHYGGTGPNAEVLERVVIQGDLSKLTAEESIIYYNAVCRSVGLNPLTQPFEYVILNNKKKLYPKKDATDQLRKIHNVNLEIVSREIMEEKDLYVVTVRATLPSGRSEEEIGVVCLTGLRGEALANALMKGVTKAKRRATLAAVGLGWLDESEVDDIPGAIRQPAPPAQPAPRVPRKAELAEKVRQGIADGSIVVPGQVIVTTTSERSPLDQLRHEVASLVLEAEELGANLGPDNYSLNSAGEDQLILWREELSVSIERQRAYNAKRGDLQGRWQKLQDAGAEVGIEVPEWDDEMSNEESIIEGRKWQTRINNLLAERGKE